MDEIQWMSLALVGHPATKSLYRLPLMNSTFVHSSSFIATLSPVWEGHSGMLLNRLYGPEVESKRRLANPDSPRMIKPVFVYLLVTELLLCQSQ